MDSKYLVSARLTRQVQHRMSGGLTSWLGIFPSATVPIALQERNKVLDLRWKNGVRLPSPSSRRPYKEAGVKPR